MIGEQDGGAPDALSLRALQQRVRYLLAHELIWRVP